jgi:hypothetical protein
MRVLPSLFHRDPPGWEIAVGSEVVARICPRLAVSRSIGGRGRRRVAPRLPQPIVLAISATVVAHHAIAPSAAPERAWFAAVGALRPLGLSIRAAAALMIGQVRRRTARPSPPIDPQAMARALLDLERERVKRGLPVSNRRLIALAEATTRRADPERRDVAYLRDHYEFVHGQMDGLFLRELALECLPALDWPHLRDDVIAPAILEEAMQRRVVERFRRYNGRNKSRR